MKRYLACAVLACAAQWAAAQLTSEASIDRLLTLTNAPLTVEGMYANLEQSIRRGIQQSAAGKQLTVEQQRAMVETSREVGVQPS